MAFGIRNDDTDDHISLMHVKTSTSLIHQVHRSPPEQEWTGDGMPKRVKFSLACFADTGERQTVVLVGHPGSHWWSGSQREYQTDLYHRTRPAAIVPFFMRGGAPQAHGSLVANPLLEMRRVSRFITMANMSEKQVAQARSSRRELMSLKSQELSPIPEETARIAHAAYPKGNVVMRMRDELGTIYQDEAFVHLFSHTGQPAEAPWRLALVTVMQFARSDFPIVRQPMQCEVGSTSSMPSG
jgi:hypothetical protein